MVSYDLVGGGVWVDEWLLFNFFFTWQIFGNIAFFHFTIHSLLILSECNSWVFSPGWIVQFPPTFFNTSPNPIPPPTPFQYQMVCQTKSNIRDFQQPGRKRRRRLLGFYLLVFPLVLLYNSFASFIFSVKLYEH